MFFNEIYKLCALLPQAPVEKKGIDSGIIAL